MKSESVAAVVSAAIALGAAFVALHAARGNSVRAAYELARSLYTELTSKDTAALRSTLTFCRLAESRTADDTRRVLDDYFALLWQFERIRAGRESLVGQRRLNGNNNVSNAEGTEHGSARQPGLLRRTRPAPDQTGP
ncbi:hypothetical protein [Streptomyces shaanxiensis]|uniref:Uncharacterized protein n=1 Tax=Streptomyces shaanxiensis TaxID=653357 RepID=A0ABP7VQL3_9ACTN